MRRILALVLSVVMVLALPVMGFAASGSSSSGRTSGSSAASTEGTTTQTLSDGTVVTTTTAADGTVTTVTTDSEGEVSADADVSNAAADAAKSSGRPVLLDVKAHADEEAEECSDVKVAVPGSAGKVAVEVTVDQLSNGVVVAQVMSDGSLKLVKTSVVGEKGLVFEAQGTATYKMLVNDKDFTDLTADWQKAGVEFASSRELMVGTSEGHFSPDDEMTAAMMATVLGRLGDDVTTEETVGETWEDKSLAWAKAEGYDVAAADEAMSREDMMVMLYKYAGSPAVTGDLSSYADADQVSDAAKDAVTWCVNNGIIFGTSSTTLSVGSTATRAQFATALMRFCAALNK